MKFSTPFTALHLRLNACNLNHFLAVDRTGKNDREMDRPLSSKLKVAGSNPAGVAIFTVSCCNFKRLPSGLRTWVRKFANFCFRFDPTELVHFTSAIRLRSASAM